MFERSAWRIALGVLVVLVIAAGILALGWMVYSAGVAQGAAQSGAAVTPEGAVPFFAYRPYFFHPYRFGFGFLGCLVPLFLVFLVFALIRPMMWGGWMGPGHRPGMHGHFRGEGLRQRWGEMAEEWHRQAHAREGAAPSSETDEGRSTPR